VVRKNSIWGCGCWGSRPTSRRPLPAEWHHQKFMFPSNYTVCSGPAKGTPMGYTIRWRARFYSIQ
jgi:hypothetical protein